MGAPDRVEAVRKLPTARDAFAYARSSALSEIRKDWAEVKDGVMRRAVHAKFSQHDDLRNLLLSTGDRRITEHTANDSYWYAPSAVASLIAVFSC